MSKATRIACSLWAQQGSNLRPLGEQRTGYPVRTTPTDHDEPRSTGYPRLPHVTGKTDDKVTADLGVRAVHRRPLGQRLADYLAARIIAALLYLPVLWAYRGERKARTR